MDEDNFQATEGRFARIRKSAWQRLLNSGEMILDWLEEHLKRSTQLREEILKISNDIRSSKVGLVELNSPAANVDELKAA